MSAAPVTLYHADLRALRDVAPVVTLYVNDYNLAAQATYRRVGFTDRGTFMSVLF